MMPLEQSHVSAIRQQFSGHENQDLDRLIPALYERLHELAHYRLQAAPRERSLDTTGLVHEAYLRLLGSPEVALVNREHFLAIASRVMRNVLVDHARTRVAHKHGRGLETLSLQEAIGVPQIDLDGVIDLDEALKKLETIDPRQGQMVELHYFGGLTLEETAATLDVSLATVKRDLRVARAWLASELTRPSA
jgi:RNA polymerase sigma factor (TIGR02999 family)